MIALTTTSIAWLLFTVILAGWVVYAFLNLRQARDEVGSEIRDLVVSLGQGGRTKSEELGHQEFILTYKSFEPLGPACLPA